MFSTILPFIGMDTCKDQSFPFYYVACKFVLMINLKLDRHGVRQLRSGWADGPAYITQCPIQTGQAYVYNFTITGQRGTLFWHAHISWLRVTIYGPIIILPKRNVPYPFPQPYKEVPIIFGNSIINHQLIQQCQNKMLKVFHFPITIILTQMLYMIYFWFKLQVNGGKQILRH